MKILHVSSWSQLVEKIESHRDGWIFRGESNPRNDTLIPKAGRYDQTFSSARQHPYSLDDEKEAFREFKRNVRPYLRHAPQTELEWLAVAQHHGVPTRLLDWTDSLLVAAFFAVEKMGTMGSPETGDAAIYAVKGLQPISEDAKPFELKEICMFRAPHISWRIPAQRSVFTIHPDPTACFEHPQLEKWVIAHQDGLCGEIKRNLDACGINDAALFPDIDGLARYIAWRYKWAFFRR
jgi:hypothetical protein